MKKITTVSMDKQDNVQVLRAVAIIAVVLIHTCPLGYAQVLCRPLLNFSVALFTFLSGYLTRENRIHDWKVFYKKRIIKIIIPYLIWTVLFTLAGNDDYGWVLNRLTGKAAAPLYYSIVYIQLVLITPILFRIIKTERSWIVWLISPLSMIFLKYIWLVLDKEMNYYFSAFSGAICLIWIIFYYLGLVLGNGNNEKFQEKLNYWNLLPFYAIAILLQIIEGYIFFKLGESNCGTQGKLTALLSSFILCLLTYVYLNTNVKILQWKWIILIGDYSYGIYLSHMMIIKLLNHIPGYLQYIPYPVTSVVVVSITFCCVHIGRSICGERLSRWFGLI